jgi:hypothetical protein
LELRLGAPEVEVVTKYAMDLDLSTTKKSELEKIAGTLMNFKKAEFNIFYPCLIYNVVTSNQGEVWTILLEHLPIYITNCLAFPDKDYISDYEKLKFKMQKYYLCEVVVKLLIYFHKQYHQTKDLSYYNAKKSVKALVQNIFEDLSWYEVVFLSSLSDTIADYVKNEEHVGDNDHDYSMANLNDEIFCLLITLMHNLNERCRGILGPQKLELLIQNKPIEESKEQPTSPSKSTTRAKQMIDQYFKIQSSRHEDITDETVRKDISRINNSVMKLVL